MVNVIIREKYLETLNALGDIQTAVDIALERYTIEQILSQINNLRARQKVYETKYGVDYETFVRRAETDETFVRALEAGGNRMWEADLLDWELCVKGIEDWKQHLQTLASERRVQESQVAYQTEIFTITHPYIELRAGEATIKGTQTKVSAVVEAWQNGMSFDALALKFRHLRLAQICDALGYYDDHRDEFGESIGAAVSLGQDPDKIRQREINRRAFLEMDANLRAQYLNKWVCIAFGKLQAVGDDWTQVTHVAREAKHRIVTQIRKTPRAPRRLPFRYRVGRFTR